MRTVALLLLLAAPAVAADLPAFGGRAAPRSFADVADVSVDAVPKKAAPGQVVTVKITVSPKPGAWTYPVDVPKGQFSKTILRGPKDGDVMFPPDAKVADPPGWVTKPRGDGEPGEDRVYKTAVTWELKAVVAPTAAPGKKTIALKGTSVQVCDKANCLFPPPLAFDIEVEAGPPVPVDPAYASLVGPPVTAAVAPTPAASAAAPPTVIERAATGGLLKKAPLPVADHAAALDALRAKLDRAADDPAGPGKGGGLRGLLVAAAFWGLVSLVTPCVFPMIPITVSLFLKQSHQSPAQVLKLAAVYCLTIVAVLGASAVFLLAAFQKLSTNPVMNVFLGGLFVVFALSLFGAYDITLPGFLLRFTEKRRGAGGLVGVVFGALAFSIVSFTCVAPFLGGFAGLAASGNFSQGELVLAGLTFAAAFASPFFVLALFPSLLKSLPRSGGWLDTVKAVMGFLELAAAFKFFRTAELRLLDPPQYFTYDVVMAAWVAIAAAAGLYLLNLYRLPHDEDSPNIGVGRLLVGLGFLGLSVYLTPALLKTGTRPAGVVFAWVDAFLLPDAGSDLPWSADLTGTLARAKQDKTKPFVFVDFTGVTCTNCRYNEYEVFPRPEVRELLQRYALVEMYTDEVPAAFYTNPPADDLRTDEARANQDFQEAAFGTRQLPLYAVLEPKADGGVRVVGVYDEGKINDVPAFVAFLKKPFGEK
jgi:thiol:disulfide interchange protein